jgi:rhodanese-related sulfurtransferase
VARHLRQRGFDAVALAGGYNAWRATHPVEPKPTGAAQRS